MIWHSRYEAYECRKNLPPLPSALCTSAFERHQGRYVANRVPLNFEHLQKRIREFNDEDITKERFMEMLHEKLSTTEMESVKQDVRGFIFNQHELDIWSNDYFLKLADMMVYKD